MVSSNIMLAPRYAIVAYWATCLTKFKAYAKAILAFCAINFAFLQHYYTCKLLTIGHDYPVPVDKHDNDYISTQSLDPIGGVRGQVFKFCNNSVSCTQFFTEISHADRGTIHMKHIKSDLRSKGLGPTS